MKILFVSNVSWSLFNFRRGLMVELKGRGHEVVFSAHDDAYTARLEQLGFRYIPIVLNRKGTDIFQDLALLLSLVRIYKKERPGLIFHNSIKPNIYGALAAHFTRCRCMNTVSGLGYAFIRKTFLSGMIRLLYKIAGLCAEKTFFQNKDDLELFVAGKLIDPGKCVRVAGSGVDVDVFRPDQNKRRPLDKNGLTFLYCGRILWDKGVGELVEAARILKKRYPLIKVCLLGMIDQGNPAGITREQVCQWEREEVIEYLGEVADVRPYLDNCHCVVLPSYREGVPRSLLEAAAMELPVIATDVPGCRDVVEHDVTGLLVTVRDVAALVKAMDVVIKMSDLQRHEMGKRARARVFREFRETLVIGTYCDCIEPMTGRLTC